MRLLGVLGAGLLVASAAACSNNVTVYDNGAGGSGAGGGTTTTTSTTPTTTTSGTSSTSSGTGGGPTCLRTHDVFDMKLDTFEGAIWGCSGGLVQEGLHNLSGQVIEAFDTSMVIDSCPPNADCMPMLNKLSFSAPSLFNPVPSGAFVKVTVRVEMPWGCSHELLVENLPSWGGVPNPVDSASKVYLLAADGVAAAPPGSPITVSSELAACSSHEEGDDYQLRFTSTYESEDLVLLMGQSNVWEASGGQFLQGRNLRSFMTGYADDYWDWAYYLVDVQLVGDDENPGQQ